MARTYPIRTITPDEFSGLNEVVGQAFLDAAPADVVELERMVIEYDRTLAAFDGELIVACGTAHSFQLTVPGGVTPAAGVTYVSVRPSYRRRGLLTAVMSRLMADAVRRREPVAILFGSEASIYGRFGFGVASMHQRLQFGRGEGALAAGPELQDAKTPRLRDVAPAAGRAELARVYDAALPHQPGMIARNDAWWDFLLADVPAMRPPGYSQLHCTLAEDDEGPRGYVLYRTTPGQGQDYLPSGKLRVRELTGTDPATLAALWTDVLSRDLVGEVIAPARPIDDALLAMLANPRQARPAPRDGLWLRLVDLPTALRLRRYSGPADLVLEVSDPHITENSGRWRLQAAGPDGAAAPACEPTAAPAGLRLPVQALGAAFLGAPVLAQLAAAGSIAELTPGALARLATAMSWDRAPFSPMVF
jgi:predicted acetyltransferase